MRWLLERRHSEIFGPNARDETDEDGSESETENKPATKSKTQTIAGIPEHLVEEARKND